MKFIKAENRYEFSRFGKINKEDKGNFFDSFSILPTDGFKQHSLAFISNAISSIKDFDSYSADTEDSYEYDHLY